MQITFTGDPQKDASLLQKAEELHILVPVEQDSEIAEKVRLADVRFHDVPHLTGDNAGNITVGIIRCQSDGPICEC